MSAHSTKNATKTACKTILVRLALSTTATAALLGAAAAPASAINQDPGGSGVVLPTPGPPATGPSGGVDATSAALGALGGIALGGAGLAVTLGLQRRRDHTATRPA
ncbi:hypothetical protein EV137_0740 [Kribbella pratensis]|uniref:LPXTG cell wall anchor domain-containing protein n=1 Tax=Kribbella pratensis TaxID=2512112 RepID=A0ABY2FKK0_9ACTN|nr:hypothetical protein [Kribbella pratensis]TDW93458.1 hypothetical protein EV137_0740 [Kribbella pratensis]